MCGQHVRVSTRGITVDRLVSNLKPFSQFTLTENDIGDRAQFTELAGGLVKRPHAIDPWSHVLPVVKASIHWKLARWPSEEV